MSEISRKSKIDASSVPGVAQRRRVTLTSAQILAMFTTPVLLLPAPPANYYHDVDDIMCLLKFNTTAYTGANAMEFRYTNGSGTKVASDAASAWLDSASSRVDKVVGNALTSAVAGAAVVAAVPVANPAAGDCTVVLDISYRTISLS